MNNQLFYFFYNFAHQSVFLDKFFVFFASIFPYIVVMLAGLFILFHHEIFKAENPIQIILQKKKEILMVFASGGLAWVIAKVLKILIHTERPFVLLKDVQSLVVDNSFAFPSGHATFFSALAVSIFFYHKKTGYWFMFFALLIGVARIVVGVHFPIDILGGFALGALIAYLLRSR
ncbi:hypothetical protein A2911_02775 [Candidatus Nomurabacteria bacterium RIFCSPLOWO2_01_FULL_40_15]|uniref:Phosphatidic acid phosphatase type 2/haloperoxidase domain-containing protein n=1 Tax=Candidatus Nomurabacteria bacterium RIFCSPLOWO2_01_FULL_40_15 TaxID=1801772 RepID=A0A1F6X8Y4_9BACT|nr:MAG: hypothetical protein A2911_02775 [Candidatus Nomurabacteria bacterium RIFCSPLOWO2_01_FULL_40_15]